MNNNNNKLNKNNEAWNTHGTHIIINNKWDTHNKNNGTHMEHT